MIFPTCTFSYFQWEGGSDGPLTEPLEMVLVSFASKLMPAMISLRLMTLNTIYTVVVQVHVSS